MSDVVKPRKQTSPPALADLPDDGSTEILLRVPPQPHCLRRLSHVCSSWRRLILDSNFLPSFRARHNDTPPLVGVFHNEGAQRFTPTGEHPSPARTFDCPAHWRVLDCRHGRVLFLAEARDAPPVLILWDPLTRRCEQIPMPPDWKVYVYGKLHGAVVCRAGHDAEGRHRDCRSGPFVVVLVIGREPLALFSVYSSEARSWSRAITVDRVPMGAFVVPRTCAVIRNSVYWPISGDETLSFDFESTDFDVIPHPPGTTWMDLQIKRLDSGKLGLVVANNADFSLHLWEWNENGGYYRWHLCWMVRLDTLKPLLAAARPGANRLRAVKLIGACDYANAIFLWTRLGSFMFHLDTKELSKLPYDSTLMLGTLHPYESFFAPMQRKAAN